jgi:hypothetical protein
VVVQQLAISWIPTWLGQTPLFGERFHLCFIVWMVVIPVQMA